MPFWDWRTGTCSGPCGWSATRWTSTSPTRSAAWSRSHFKTCTRDFTQKALATRLAVECGRRGKPPKLEDVIAALALIGELAVRRAIETEDEIARAWGESFLEQAGEHPLDWNDQGERCVVWCHAAPGRWLSRTPRVTRRGSLPGALCSFRDSGARWGTQRTADGSATPGQPDLLASGLVWAYGGPQLRSRRSQTAPLAGSSSGDRGRLACPYVQPLYSLWPPPRFAPPQPPLPRRRSPARCCRSTLPTPGRSLGSARPVQAGWVV